MERKGRSSQKTYLEGWQVETEGEKTRRREGGREAERESVCGGKGRRMLGRREGGRDERQDATKKV